MPNDREGFGTVERRALDAFKYEFPTGPSRLALLLTKEEVLALIDALRLAHTHPRLVMEGETLYRFMLLQNALTSAFVETFAPKK